jgi:hypothetical protein
LVLFHHANVQTTSQTAKFFRGKQQSGRGLLQSEGQVPLIDRMPNFMLRNHFFDAPIEHAADGQEYH